MNRTAGLYLVYFVPSLGFIAFLAELAVRGRSSTERRQMVVAGIVSVLLLVSDLITLCSAGRSPFHWATVK